MAVECTNAIANEEMVEKMVREATVQRYAPVHVYRQAPVHLQYRKGLTEIFELHDPANIHTEEPVEQAATTTDENDKKGKRRR